MPGTNTVIWLHEVSHPGNGTGTAKGREKRPKDTDSLMAPFRLFIEYSKSHCVSGFSIT